MMNRILHETGATSYKAFLSGSENFRYGIDPSYKANRVDVRRPEWLQPIREHLVVRWCASISDGIEADDNLGIEQTDDTVICSLDKDLLQVPGKHYNWVKQEWTEVSIWQGWYNFYTQLILGDRADNIQGYDGKMRQTVPKFLQPFMDSLYFCTTPKEMWDKVESIYELGNDTMYRNAQLLYVLRKAGDKFQIPE